MKFPHLQCGRMSVDVAAGWDTMTGEQRRRWPDGHASHLRAVLIDGVDLARLNIASDVPDRSHGAPGQGHRDVAEGEEGPTETSCE
jgi:hypothetical protein